MLALIRNPLYRLLARFWWVPILLGTALATIGQPPLWELALALWGLGAGILIASTLVARVQGYRERRRVQAYTANEQYRFLCPECFRFGEPAYACGACGKECAALAADTGGGYVNDCAHCQSTLLPAEREGAVGLLAYCRHCQATTDRYPHHERRICVIGVPSPADLECFPHADRLERRVAVTASGLRLDDHSWLTYVLPLGALTPHARAPDHAARQLEALWLSGKDVNALVLGEQLDGFIRSARLSATARRKMRIYLGCGRMELARDVYNVLEGRFPNPAQLEFDVQPEGLIERLTTLPDQEAGRKLPRVLAVLADADWRAVRALTDQYGGPLLHPDGRYRQPGGQSVRVCNAEWVPADAVGFAPELALVEAVWLSGREDGAVVIDRLDRLVRGAELAGERRVGLVICIAEAQPDPRLINALHARFRTVRSGVSAEEFLWHGREARAPTLLAGPTLRLATCLPGDFEALFREMGVLQRARLSATSAVEETGNRTTFLADLAPPAGALVHVAEAPAMREVQAIWLGETLPRALELAERLDGLMRNVWGTKQRRRELVACLWTAAPEVAVRNVLEARFGAVRYGVSARDFLEHGARAANRERLAYEDAPAVAPQRR